MAQRFSIFWITPWCTTELWMPKYIIGEIFSSGGETLYKNPSDQTMINWGSVCLPTRTCSGNSATNAYAIPWGITVRPTVKPAMRSATPKKCKQTQYKKCKQKSAGQKI